MQDREGFNFYRSYYETSMLLDGEDRLEFLDAIINYQFTGELVEPKRKLALLAFKGQIHSIRKQVIGYQKGIQTYPTGNPTKGKHKGRDKGSHKEVQVQVEDKEELSANIFNFKNSLLELCHDENLVNDFMKVRKTKKATNTETAFNSLKREIENSGRGAAECLRVCIERDWKGFKSDWLNKINENGKSTEQSIADWLNM